MSLAIVLWQPDTHVDGKRWAGQVIADGQQAPIHKPGKQSVPWDYAPPRTARIDELSELMEKLLSDWRAAEAHAT